MTTFNFNELLENAKSASYEALPIGDYNIEITEANATTSQNGKPMIKVKMRVTAGPYEKRQLFNQFVLSIENPQALAIFFRHMAAFGLDQNFFAQLGQTQDLTPVAQALLGRHATVTLGHREWQGETRNDVTNIKPIQGGVPSPNGLPGNAAPMPQASVPAPSAVPTPAPTVPTTPASAPAPQAQAPAAPAPAPPAPPAPAAPQQAPAPQAPAPQSTYDPNAHSAQIAQSVAPAPAAPAPAPAAPPAPPAPEAAPALAPEPAQAPAPQPQEQTQVPQPPAPEVSAPPPAPPF